MPSACYKMQKAPRLYTRRSGVSAYSASTSAIWPKVYNAITQKDNCCVFATYFTLRKGRWVAALPLTVCVYLWRMH